MSNPVPTQPGYYWVRQDYKQTRGIMRGTPWVTHVILSLPPRCRKPETPKVLMIYGMGWRQPLSELSDEMTHWGKKIECDIPE